MSLYSLICAIAMDRSHIGNKKLDEDGDMVLNPTMIYVPCSTHGLFAYERQWSAISEGIKYQIVRNLKIPRWWDDHVIAHPSCVSRSWWRRWLWPSFREGSPELPAWTSALPTRAMFGTLVHGTMGIYDLHWITVCPINLQCFNMKPYETAGSSLQSPLDWSPIEWNNMCTV